MRSVIAANADLASGESIDAFEGPFKISSENMPSDLTGLTRQDILFKIIFDHFAQLFSIYERFPVLQGESSLRSRFAQGYASEFCDAIGKPLSPALWDRG